MTSVTLSIRSLPDKVRRMTNVTAQFPCYLILFFLRSISIIFLIYVSYIYYIDVIFFFTFLMTKMFCFFLLFVHVPFINDFVVFFLTKNLFLEAVFLSSQITWKRKGKKTSVTQRTDGHCVCVCVYYPHHLRRTCQAEEKTPAKDLRGLPWL